MKYLSSKLQTKYNKQILKRTAGFRVLSASIAASRAGMASARSASHSSLIDWASVAAAFATASSAATICSFAGRLTYLRFEISRKQFSCTLWKHQFGDIYRMADLTSFLASTSTESRSIFIMIWSTSADVFTSSGCKSLSSFCITATYTRYNEFMYMTK